LELEIVRRAQTVWAVSAFTAAAAAFVLLSFLPFSFWINGAIAGLTFWVIAGSGYRYFLTRATPGEIRHDLEDRKNFPSQCAEREIPAPRAAWTSGTSCSKAH
jgi:hypothetical protein